LLVKLKNTLMMHGPMNVKRVELYLYSPHMPSWHE